MSFLKDHKQGIVSLLDIIFGIFRNLLGLSCPKGE